ncbi:JmjC- JMjN-domain containing protein [Parasponia andersonii]|uniref:JmjC-JMjN-domain containing protein n=1 Tax=Parasponia andersonii TaxID=3476 RepID=A0A2P5CNP8_PARAD|nr:JmjC- JMjN-domain containing protein [Parasponia andersonii]
MGKNYEASKLSNKHVKNLPVPPGFTSLSSFRLKKIAKGDDETDNSKDHLDASIEDPLQVDTIFGMSGNDMLERSLRRRPWILFDAANHKSDESDSEQFDEDFSSKTCLPKGVIRGCPDCSNCVKVTARWRPTDTRTDILEEAAVFYPTEEEFKDILEYIGKIRQRAEPLGICRIVPPPSWNPPCVIKEKNIGESNTFVTHVQRIDGLQVPYSRSGSKTTDFVQDINSKKRRTLSGETGSLDTEHFESVPGPEFTVKTFKRYADDFKGQYFCKSKVTDSNDCSMSEAQWEPSVENIEGEYKRIVDDPTEEIEVLCCDNLETGVFGSRSPTASNPLETPTNPEIVNSGLNLSNVGRLPGSLLSFESYGTSCVLVPRIRLGMCFSTLHWRVEEHHLYSLSYLHMGAPKIWYGIPGKYSVTFGEALKNSFNDMFGNQHELHHRLVKKLLPFALNSEGIPVFRCIQNPGELILVFPGAYHSGFDCGFNCSETANFAPLDWLPHGQNAVEIYRELGKKTSISHDKLLLQAAFKAVRAQWQISLCGKKSLDNQLWQDACGKEGILAKAFKSRVMCEDITRRYLCNSSQTRRMDVTFDATSKRECKICLYDLHFSAAGCPCSEEIYSCLNHAKQLCSCDWTEKFFLFRHDISDLNLLVDALEGKLKSVYKYAKDFLGLSLNSHASKDRVRASREGDCPTSHADKLEDKQLKFQNGETPNHASGTGSNIRAEMKRLLKSKVSDKFNAVNNGIESPKAATRSCIGEKVSSSIKADMKARSAESAISKGLKAKAGVQNKKAPAGIGYSSFLQMEATYEVPYESSSEESSEESDGTPDLHFSF